MAYTPDTETQTIIEVTDEDQFDFAARQGRILVDRLRAVATQGEVVEVAATGTLYRASGILGKATGCSQIQPPSAGEEPFDADVFDAPWSALPAVARHEIRAALFGAGARA